MCESACVHVFLSIPSPFSVKMLRALLLKPPSSFPVNEGNGQHLYPFLEKAEGKAAEMRPSFHFFGIKFEFSVACPFLIHMTSDCV